MRRILCQFTLSLVMMVFMTRPTLACSVCYGEPDSPMSQGLTWAVAVLAGMISLVLVAVAAFFIRLNRRSHKLTLVTAAGNSGS